MRFRSKMDKRCVADDRKRTKLAPREVEIVEDVEVVIRRLFRRPMGRRMNHTQHETKQYILLICF